MIDIISEKATRVSVSAGTAWRLKLTQNIRKVLMWDLIFFAVPGAKRNCCVATAASSSNWNW